MSSELLPLRVIVVDDSLVRGNTARARVRNLRAAGAKEGKSAWYGR